MSIRRIRVKALRWALLPLIPMALFIKPPWPEVSAIDYAMNWVGYAFLITGLGLRMWSMFYLGSRKSRELVTEGPFSICRNPLYVGTFMVFIGVSLCFENLVMLIFATSVAIPVHFVAVRSEERHLKELFQDEYEAYCRSTPRFLFRLANYRSSGTVSVSTRLLRRVVIDVVGVALVPALADLVDTLHIQGILPVVWTFP